MNNVITAPGTPQETSVWLGRPWHDRPKTVFINTRAEVSIPATGWYPTMGGLPALWAEYNTMDGKGNPIDLSHRITEYYYTDTGGNRVTGQSATAVPASILKPGENLVTVRLINYGGAASFVPDKPYCLAWGIDTVRLSSRWKYQLGCEMPARTNSVSFQNVPTGMYNSMISPLRNLTFTGALWYQGETNTGRPNEYEELLAAMIIDWREKLADKELPFFIVQLANFMQTHPEPVESNWAALREAQRQVALKVPNAALAVAIDLGEWNDIHPLNKKELARRISLLAKRGVYGDKKSVHNGPMCTGMTVNHEGKAILSFEAGTDKLRVVDELKGFAIAGADGHFQWAEAVVVNGNQVAVWHKDIPHPVTVRYGWDDNPVHANLRNMAGLPASPFQISLGGQ